VTQVIELTRTIIKSVCVIYKLIMNVFRNRDRLNIITIRAISNGGINPVSRVPVMFPIAPEKLVGS